MLPRHAFALAILAAVAIVIVGFAWRAWHLHKADMDNRWGGKRRRRRK